LVLLLPGSLEALRPEALKPEAGNPGTATDTASGLLGAFMGC
tara:strand:+ start:3395 stop:3520 length:126 start_codon:yes stop_codon:yes gene_type:complete